MTRRIVATSRARRDMTRLPESAAFAVDALVRGDLVERPWVVGKPLRGPLEGRWAARRGDYRIIFTFDDDTLTIHSVTHRRDAYRSGS